MSSEIIDKLIECGVLALDHDCLQSEICESTTDLADNILEEYDVYDDDSTTYLLEKAKLPSCISWEESTHAHDILIWETYDDAEEFAVKDLANSFESDIDAYQNLLVIAIENEFTNISDSDVKEQLIHDEVDYFTGMGESNLREELSAFNREYEEIAESYEDAKYDLDQAEMYHNYYEPVVGIAELSEDFRNYLLTNNVDCDMKIIIPYLRLSGNSEDRLLEVRDIVDIYGTMKILSNYTQDSVGEFDDQFQTLLSSKDRENVVLGHDLMTRLEEYDSHNLFEIVGRYPFSHAKALRIWKNIYQLFPIYENIAYIISTLGKSLQVRDLSSSLGTKMIAVDVSDISYVMRFIILGFNALDTVDEDFRFTKIEGDKEVDKYSTYDVGLEILRHLGDYNLWIKNHKKFGSRLKDALEITCAVLNYFYDMGEDYTYTDDEMEEYREAFNLAENEYESFDIYDYDMWYEVFSNTYSDWTGYEILRDRSYSDKQILNDWYGGIDYEELARYVIRVDGIGHAIGYYDGTLHECDDLYYVLR